MFHWRGPGLKGLGGAAVFECISTSRRAGSCASASASADQFCGSSAQNSSILMLLRTEGVAEAFAAFVGVLGERGRAVGFAGRAAGTWALEEEILYKEAKSRVFLFVVAWESVEAYVRFRDSEEFKSLLAPIAGLRGLRELDICLVDLKDADADA
ncbi:hypothetical protein EKO27_g2456 [Xylaria grammica]|uniref:ABM domain-containing protein n=1 Tax=Xylaria grammica TaxID=363999 RepID=A0A439DDY8_9PEZI|nr:hypothetical protein EKO27_g2456 [Xylaria grammica]